MDGDALLAVRSSGGEAVVVGGNDTIAALGASGASLFGDIAEVREGVAATGSNDSIGGSAQVETISGDVGTVTRADGTSIVGGDDEINSKGGATGSLGM